MIKKALFIFALILALVLSGCSNNSENADMLLSELLAVSGENFEDSGIFYFCNSAEGEVGYLSKDDQALIFGKDSISFDKIHAYAGFVSARTPAELWVFKCHSASDTDDVVKMCLERADVIKVALRNTEWREKTKNISIKVYHRHVIFAFVEDARAVERKAQTLI